MNNDTVKFVAELIILTLQDDTMTGWEKFKYISWLIYVTAPARPILF